MVEASAFLSADTLDNGMEYRADYGLEETPFWENMDASTLPEVTIIEAEASLGPRSADRAGLLSNSVEVSIHIAGSYISPLSYSN